MTISHKKTTKKKYRDKYREEERKRKSLIVNVLDTSVLIDDPFACDRYPGNVVYVCGVVMNELDKIKAPKIKSNDEMEKAQKARTAISYLDQKASQNRFGLSEDNKHHFYPGNLIIDVSKPKIPSPEKYDVDWNYSSNDHKIIMVCLELRESGKDVVLVTNDINMKLFASAPPISLRVQSY